jgi:hypothetical protein
MSDILTHGAYRFVVDHENTNEDWWHAARNATDVPPELSDLLAVGTDAADAIVPHPRAEAVAVWCESLPGWNDSAQPLSAPHPLIIEDWS